MVNPVDFDESQSQRLARKAKESPFMLAGIAGLAAVCGLGVHKFKSRGEMSPSVYLMRLRVAASGTIVAACAIGVTLQMSKDYLFNQKRKE